MEKGNKVDRYAWRGKIKGDIAEYKRRHDEIWPEMKQVLDEAGILTTLSGMLTTPSLATTSESGVRITPPMFRGTAL